MTTASESSASVFRVCAVTSSHRCEIIVSSSYKNEVIFGSSTYALIASSDRTGREVGLREVPVHLIFDSGVAVGESKISRTVEQSLFDSVTTKTDIIGRSISLLTIGRPPVAPRVYVSLSLTQSAEQALLADISLGCLQDIAAMGIRHQPFNSIVRFALTGWMTATVVLWKDSSSKDGVASPFLVGKTTVLEFTPPSEPVLTDKDSLRQRITNEVSSQFVGSANLIKTIASMLCAIQDNINGESSTSPRGMVIAGGAGSGKTLLCTVLQAVVSSLYIEQTLGRVPVAAGGRAQAFDLRRLDEMERCVRFRLHCVGYPCPDMNIRLFQILCLYNFFLQGRWRGCPIKPACSPDGFYTAVAIGQY